MKWIHAKGTLWHVLDPYGPRFKGSRVRSLCTNLKELYQNIEFADEPKGPACPFCTFLAMSQKHR